MEELAYVEQRVTHSCSNGFIIRGGSRFPWVPIESWPKPEPIITIITVKQWSRCTQSSVEANYPHIALQLDKMENIEKVCDKP